MLIEFAKAIYIFFTTRSISKARFFCNWQGGTNRSLLNHFAVVGNSLVYLPTNFQLSKEVYQLFGRNLPLLLHSITHNKAIMQEGRLWLHTKCRGEDIRAVMANHESILCMEEVFGKEAYFFSGLQNAVVVDVGMNIGLASLYFACLPEVGRVYGYELVEATAKEAQRNILANPTIANKIEVFHAGLSIINSTTTIPITGAGDVGASLQMQREGNNVEEVSLIAAATLLQDLAIKHPTQPIVLKLDCEGEEYAIVEHLHCTGWLRQIAIVMIEWHIHGSHSIVTTLVANGFICFAPGIGTAASTGFIYAVQNSLK